MRKLTPRDVVGHVWHLPVCYDPRFAIDLDDVARRASLTPQQVVERHSGPTYHVYMLGFLPGQAYMGDVPAELALDRLQTPRTKIPAGSLAIAATMSCVFPLETPCGWHIIGRCPIPLWDHARATALLAPADKVMFVPVSAREYDTLVTRASEDVLRLEPVSEFIGAVA
jgi:inhibitor of KinA